MLRGGIVGFGQVVEKAHVPAFARTEGLRITAVAESRPERREAAAKLLPAAKVYPTMETMLDAEALDFVDIATPPSFHAPQTLQALSRGVHVLCEKPLALDLESLDRIQAEAARRDLAAFTVHNWKHAPLLRKLGELVHGGALGQVRHAELHTLRNQPAANVPSGTLWRTDVKTAGGGILVDHGWHCVYLLAWLLGETPVNASGTLRFPAGSQAEEEATCLLEFPKATAVVHLSWKAAARSHRGIVYGDRGTIEIFDDKLVMGGETFSFPEPLSHGSAHPDWFHDMLSDFEGAVRGGSERAQNAREARACAGVLDSLYKGRRPSLAGSAA